MCDGKFGVCGDSYSGASESRNLRRLRDVSHQHRENVIGACYASGSTVDLQVQLTANHKGQQSPEYPCAAGKQYFGRGPIQLSWNYNYEDFGKAVNLDLVVSPELVATDYDLVWWMVLER
ncbi:hypothetical protein DYB30_012633 [Aphanomyces astaci]|uniref:Glycoside hydrolase family 19 catalytic domain-containing protein n=1 Tax=Aphanomyces astaci TaxID=112090 RepID=A0A397EGG9_APHAT|nr:hypothetical protein DYB30_012633 [Aphanomyces astaci]